uniref:Uncharacterized protein ALNC14_063580 n=1 Tax=Albugo laibachii Nc14 TaxID=890382 RepID=F0WG80_9STRA|nr:unnamed protein product [Albugo laibachii Nc14]|eukprot:CCA20215.1 unnamed protein product [Albugo laibachii Nc14]
MFKIWTLLVLTPKLLFAKASKCFPSDFLFGSATAAYQVEGAWNEGGRTLSVWDEWCRSKEKLECANVADDFYHRYQSDLELMEKDGLNMFRFSISWSRVMNWNGTTSKMQPNPVGIAYYHRLIDEMTARKLTPVLTLYHWDLPLELQNELEPTSWLNANIVNHYLEYAALMYQEFGKKVLYWTTFNEPLTFVTQGYAYGIAPPGIRESWSAMYTAAHHVLLSHAHSVKLFRDYKERGIVDPAARISIALNCDIGLPLDRNNERDVIAAERKNQFTLGWYLLPIVSGDYPSVMKERAGENLQTFTMEEKQLLKGSYDLLMLNHYSTRLVTDCDSDRSTVNCSKLTGYNRHIGVDSSRFPEGSRRASTNRSGHYNCDWFAGYAPGYLESIRWMHDKDPTADILLTENGWCGNETIINTDQLWYHQTYLDQVHKAIFEEHIPIIGYTVWSFMDNYEWGSFDARFGLYYVNMSEELRAKNLQVTPKSTDLERIPRVAAKWYRDLAKTKCFEPVSVNEITPVNKLSFAKEQYRVSGGSTMRDTLSTGVIVAAIVAVITIMLSTSAVGQTKSTQLTNIESAPLMASVRM